MQLSFRVDLKEYKTRGCEIGTGEKKFMTLSVRFDIRFDKILCVFFLIFFFVSVFFF